MFIPNINKIWIKTTIKNLKVIEMTNSCYC